jgi:type IV pilus assembly protein PilC
MLKLLVAVIGPVLVVVVPGAAVGAAVRRIRHERLRHVIQALALAVGQGLPLAPALRAFARGERRRLKQAYECMARRLEQGELLSLALQQAMPSCPERIISALRAAERGGTTPTVLRSLAAELRADSGTAADSRAPLVYSCFMLGVVTLVLGMLGVALAPKFRDIFTDYQVELPPLTQAVLQVPSSPVARLAFLVLVAPAAVLLTVCIRRGNARPLRARVPPTVQAYDAISWVIPGLRRLVKSEALGRELPVMLAALRAGVDLPQAADQAASVDVNYWARRRLAHWAAALVRGDDLVQAARRSGLPTPFVQALAASREGGDLPAALEYLIGYYRSLAVHWQHVVLSAAVPMIVVCWALVVGVVALSVFLPEVTLVQSILASMD